jgi:putative transposase
MAQQAVGDHAVSIRLACRAFSISETCYRYQSKLNDDNALIAEQLIELTEENTDWGFGLCFSYLRHVEKCGWNHKRVYRIYCELALNLRIKPRRRLKRHVPEPLKEPTHPNQVWSLDFMHDQLSDGRSYRLLNVESLIKMDLQPLVIISFIITIYLKVWVWLSMVVRRISLRVRAMVDINTLRLCKAI